MSLAFLNLACFILFSYAAYVIVLQATGILEAFRLCSVHFVPESNAILGEITDTPLSILCCIPELGKEILVCAGKETIEVAIAHSQGSTNNVSSHEVWVV